MKRTLSSCKYLVACILILVVGSIFLFTCNAAPTVPKAGAAPASIEFYTEHGPLRFGYSDTVSISIDPNKDELCNSTTVFDLYDSGGLSFCLKLLSPTALNGSPAIVSPNACDWANLGVAESRAQLALGITYAGQTIWAGEDGLLIFPSSGSFMPGQPVDLKVCCGRAWPQTTTVSYSWKYALSQYNSNYYTIAEGSDAVTITGVKSGTPSTVWIPSAINGKPVTVASKAFTGSTVTQITVCDGVTLAADAFSGLTGVTITHLAPGDNNVYGATSGTVDGMTFWDASLTANDHVAVVQDGSRLIVTGQGTLAAKDKTTALSGSTTAIEIRDGVVGIDYNAFYAFTQLTSLRLPNTLETVKDGAFMRCFSLQQVTIPASVKSLGIYSFGLLYSLQTVTFERGFSGSMNQAFFTDQGGYITVRCEKGGAADNEGNFYRSVTFEYI